MNVIKIFGIVMLSCIGYVAFDHLVMPLLTTQKSQIQATHPLRHNQPVIDTRAPMTEPMMHESFSADCNRHMHCSQMHSCEEAKQWLARCPNAEIDGDGDGIPCERQWCYPSFH